ncbi:hypothetical protein [Desulfococcus multivorans]|uniref:Peptidase M3A and M3B thimet/oligopeptidase F n=1 Tax=Desulfococcus multivorans DSM 2059 TaxID=1121405 RepID=S7UPJ1_DESML|nr:hypothetical protein [Desulfococcus multivorans]AOY59937.1 conserved uncharacterized protein [Desulfococcus multivorans]AQV02090.1 hypothetical protein B2D07_15845 [Desulfococcus multivorans]EPR35934.1 hypothetical protein dsmv_0639 [Desulfococcus multivorans DSM 2059]SJZ35375.1 hypothetical protein SAMN02745446_00155 [Desulfococcus multivorans DSM 2059]
MNDRSIRASDAPAAIERALHDLNRRWSAHILSLWKGETPETPPYAIYDGYDALLSLETLAGLDGVGDPERRRCLRHALMDHYLQRLLLPHELEMRTWMRGAKAEVDGEKIGFHEVIPWCQADHSYEKRQILQKETGALCKFLKPFVLNHWELLLSAIRDDLGFDGYVDYCSRKHDMDYGRWYPVMRDFLHQTDALYFDRMARWCEDRFHRPMADLTRFDSINLLSLAEFDGGYPSTALEDTLEFFSRWGFRLEDLPGLHLDMRTDKQSAQALSVFVDIPDAIHILMRPQGGWIDLETLWHELGHGLSAVFTDSGLSAVIRNMSTNYSLSEAYAFLLQNAVMSRPFLTGYLEISPADADILHYYKSLRDLAAFRRYAARFLAEYEMFSGGNLADGDPYARTMQRYTGFYHQPESHLFDLVPEFYSLNYLLGWMGEASLEKTLRDRWGAAWVFRRASGDRLRKWWHQGNRYDIFQFLARNRLAPVHTKPLLERWREALQPK